MIGQMEDRPQAANSLLKRLKTLLNFAADIDMIQHNPLLGMRGLKVSSEGFHTWTEEEIAQFEAYHPIGTKARLAMALMLYTGQRKSDAVKMRSEEHTSELQSLMRITYAVFSLKK